MERRRPEETQTERRSERGGEGAKREGREQDGTGEELKEERRRRRGARSKETGVVLGWRRERERRCRRAHQGSRCVAASTTALCMETNTRRVSCRPSTNVP